MSALGQSGKGSSVVYWLCRAVVLESIRRRETSVVLLFMGLFVMGAVTARFVGAESDAAAAFILNLGISMAWILSMLIAILMAARQFPDELEQRSLYPLLAKPVARYQYVLGKWLATWLTASGTAIVLNLLALAASPWPSALSILTLAQALVLEILALGMVTAISIALSMKLPKAMSIVIAALLAFGGGSLITMIQSAAAMSSSRSAVLWFTGYIPNFSKLDLINAFSAGSAGLGATDFLARIVYGIIVIIFSLIVAAFVLERKPL